jgi:hypothetical protein
MSEMSDMNNFSFENTEYDVNNDYIHPITGLVDLIHLMINWDKMMVSLNLPLLK